MAGDGKGDKITSKNQNRLGINPLRLVDAAGAFGVLMFLIACALSVSGAPEGVAALVRDVSLLLVGCVVVVRALDYLLRHRDGREIARRELLRRMTLLNDALLDLRKSLGHDYSRRFLDRRAEFAAGLKLANKYLTPEEATLAKTCGEFCDRMEKGLAETIDRRGAVTAAVDRLNREIERAARRGDIDQHDADDLIDIVADAVSVLDDAIYAEWNVDHFGRLSADQRHFARELSRYKSTVAGEIDGRGRQLFDQLLVHVRQKVEMIDLIVEWDEVYRKFEMRISGLPLPVLTPEQRRAKKEEKPKPRPSERFPTLAVPHGDDDNDARRLLRRMPAAND